MGWCVGGGASFGRKGVNPLFIPVVIGDPDGSSRRGALVNMLKRTRTVLGSLAVAALMSLAPVASASADT